LKAIAKFVPLLGLMEERERKGGVERARGREK